jgi:hypothetical protein
LFGRVGQLRADQPSDPEHHRDREKCGQQDGRNPPETEAPQELDHGREHEG